jgi:uridine phosphorylase
MEAPHRDKDSIIPHSELILRPEGSIYHLGITAEHIANKVIIVGDPERVPKISALFEEVTHKIAGREFIIHTGKYKGKEITVISSGIGVDNIDIVMTELDAAVNVDYTTRKPKEHHTCLEIVRIGTSGCMHADIPVGSFVSSSYSFALDGVPHTYDAVASEAEQKLHAELSSQFEWLRNNSGFYVAQCDAELHQRIAFDAIHGITATANGFYGPQGRSVRLKSNMENRIDTYAQFRYDGLRITNFEMESAGIYALASMLGHKAVSVCAILVNRATKEFNNDSLRSVETLIRTVLERF